MCYLEGENLKYGMLQSFLFDMTNQCAVIGVEEFEFNYCDFASGSSDSAFKNCLNSLGVPSFVSKIGAKLDILYISLTQLVGLCGLNTQNQNKYCFKLCQTIEHD